MNFVITTENLLTGLKRVQNAVSSKPNLQILNTILIEAKDGQVCLTAYDTEMRIKSAVTASVLEEGRVALQARRLIGTISTLPAGEVTMETTQDEAGMVRISCNKINFRMRGMDADSFPAAELFEEEWSFGIGGSEMVDCLKKVFYARSEDVNRKALNGVLFTINNGIRTIVASDGRRLALIERAIENPDEEGKEPVVAAPTGGGNFILPSPAAAELCSTIDQSKPVLIHLSKSAVVFENGSTTITSKLVDSTYPNYRSVIPASFQQQVVIPRAIFADVLKRAKMVLDENPENSSILLNIQQNQMTVSASSESSDMSESMDVELTGEPVAISFNPNYLMDPIKTLCSDKIAIKFNSSSTPVGITGDDGFIYILMPMRG